MRQMQIDFEPGLTELFPEFRDVVHGSVYGCGRAFKAVAADLDMSPSELSRKLANNPNDPVHFPLDRLPELLRATGDLRPVYWLIETFLEAPDVKQGRLVAEAAEMMKRLSVLLEHLPQPPLERVRPVSVGRGGE